MFSVGGVVFSKRLFQSDNFTVDDASENTLIREATVSYERYNG